MSRFQAVKGMRDLLPADAATLRFVEAAAKAVARLYGFEEVITPLVEYHELMGAKSGEEIKARMYAFDDMGGRKVVLRPEFTASIARLLATVLRNAPKPLRLFSSGTLYRYDEPQLGRYREFWQSNFEIFGSDRPEADVEILTLTNDLVRKTGLRKYWFKIGHVGIIRGLLDEEGVNEDRQNTIMQLLDAKRWNDALETARELGVSGKGIEVLKTILDTKGKDASDVLTRTRRELEDYASSTNAVDNLQLILELCDQSFESTDLFVEPGFARGLEYYTGLVFEILVPELDISLGGGGRYDRLVALFGGEPTPAVGVAHGLDRIQLALLKQGTAPVIPRRIVTIIPIGQEAVPTALAIAHQLREEEIAAETEVMGRAVSRALQDADRRGADYAVILGPKELEQGKVTLRDMKTREQRLVNIEELGKELAA